MWSKYEILTIISLKIKWISDPSMKLTWFCNSIDQIEQLIVKGSNYTLSNNL